ncbi:MAG: hypothetical protein ACI90V_014346 [Bacillariaceae sp.]
MELSYWGDFTFGDFDFKLSRDGSMLAIYARGKDMAMLYSIDNDNRSTTLKQSFSAWARFTPIRSTLDDNCISHNNQNGLAFWNITTGREVTDQINTTYNKNEDKSVEVVGFSPAGRGGHVIVEDDNVYDDKVYLYIDSSYLGKLSKTIKNNIKDPK